MSRTSIDKIPANRRLVDELYAHGKISYEAKEYALEILHPADNWGAWISRLLLSAGSALVLSGIVYFFAFNWTKITPFIKFSSIQIDMVGCLLGAYRYSLKSISGQILLLSASVLTGVFMAVFGQVYQTGADSYQLFMMWSILILGWTIIANFAPQWTLWLVITNTFLILWWTQAALPEPDMEFMIYAILSVFNGTALALREYLARSKDNAWAQPKWTRVLLVIATLLPMLIPIVALIVEPNRATPSIFIAAVLGFAGHALLYFFYRYKIQDMWSLSATALSICIIVEATGLKVIVEMFDGLDFFMFLLMGLMTIGIFTAAVMYLRKIIDVLEVDHV
ncbi:MAG: DUF2157 domain-containing protein [Pseudomonadota bacterium]